MAKTTEQKDKFLQTVRDNRKIAVDGWHDIYSKSLEDMRFIYDIDNAQWPEGMESTVKLTANNLLKFVRQIRADARQNRPRLKVVPVDSLADVRMAELYNGIIRQIEHLSTADIVYDNTYNQSVSGSIGFFRIVTEFESPDTFDQGVRIKRLRNPFNVRFDPSAREFNFEDAQYCFIDEWVKRDEFERRWPKADAVDFTSGNPGQAFEGWFEPDKVRIAEYYHKVKVPITVVSIERRLENGQTVTESGELTERAERLIAQTGSKIIRKRESFKTEVKWSKVTGVDVLEETDWIGTQIPVFAMQGDEIIVDGQRHLLSFHRGAHDMQRMLNFWITKATKIMAKTPDAPFLLTPEQIEGHENMWSQANALERAYLLYESTKDGKPSRERNIDPPTGMLSMIQTMAEGIEDHLGMFDASKGAPSNERSGRAIRERINQSAKGSFVFLDNRTRAMIYALKQIVEIIPKVYDTERALQVRGEDGQTQKVVVNRPTGELDVFGQPIIENDLSIGKFDLIETIGSATVSQRQEERQDLLSSLQFAGDLAPALVPLIFELSDSPNSRRVTEAINKFLESQQQAQTQGETNG